MDIPRKFQTITVLVYQDRVVSSLKQMPSASSSRVKVIRIAGVYMMENAVEISSRCLQEEMVVIGHETEAVDPSTVFLGR
jgi:hypothetical protein